MQIKTKIFSSHTADSKPVKQEVNSTVILPPLVFPGQRVDKAKSHYLSCNHKERRRIIKTDKKVVKTNKPLNILKVN
jgi:hypothetical protein